MKLQANHTPVLAIMTLAIASSGMFSSPCKGQYVINEVREAVVPDHGKLITSDAAKPKGASPAFDPVVEAGIRAIVQGAHQGRSIGMPTPNGPDAQPGVPVPDTPGDAKGATGGGATPTDWAGFATNIVGGILSQRQRRERWGGYRRGRHVQRSGSYPQVGSTHDARPPQNEIRRQPRTRVSRHIVLLNPSTTTTAVHFVLEGKAHTLSSGYAQDLDVSEDVIIEFDRGGSYGLARYTLSEGTYEFTLASNGWDLVTKVDANTINDERSPTTASDSPAPNKLPKRLDRESQHDKLVERTIRREVPRRQRPSRRVRAPQLGNELQRLKSVGDYSIDPGENRPVESGLSDNGGGIVGYDAQGNPISRGRPKGNKDADRARANANAGIRTLEQEFSSRQDDAFSGHRRGAGNAPLINPRFSGSAVAGTDRSTHEAWQFKVTRNDKVYLQEFEWGPNSESFSQHRIHDISAGQVLDLVRRGFATVRQDEDGWLVRVKGNHTAAEIRLAFGDTAKAKQGSNSPDDGPASWHQLRYTLNKLAGAQNTGDRHNPWIDKYGNPTGNGRQATAGTSATPGEMSPSKSHAGRSGDLVNPVPDEKAGNGSGKAPIDPDPDSPRDTGNTPLMLRPIQGFHVVDPIGIVRERTTTRTK